MTLLIDTDALCKLATCGLLENAVKLLGEELSTCGRLAALPHMLKRGRLYKRFGPDNCERIARVAKLVPAIATTNSPTTDQLTKLDQIDPGEALLFAKAIDEQMFVLTGDKRALKALKGVHDFHVLLKDRIITFEAILLALCEEHGFSVIYPQIFPLVSLDKMVRICFPPKVQDPQDCLRSFYSELTKDVKPLTLWSPNTVGAAK